MVDQTCNPNDPGDRGRGMVTDLRPAWSIQQIPGQLEYSETLRSQLMMKQSQKNTCARAVAIRHKQQGGRSRNRDRD